MAEVYGENGFLYEYVDGWGTLPDGMTYVECPGVAVDSKDNVFILTRGEHPVIVFDKEGNFLRTFGEGYFSNRTTGCTAPTTTPCSSPTMASTPFRSSRPPASY